MRFKLEAIPYGVVAIRDTLTKKQVLIGENKIAILGADDQDRLFFHLDPLDARSKQWTKVKPHFSAHPSVHVPLESSESAPLEIYYRVHSVVERVASKYRELCSEDRDVVVYASQLTEKLSELG